MSLLEFGAPNECKCPHCGLATYLWFDDYDMDCGHPANKQTEFECEHCNKKFYIKLVFTCETFISK